MRDVIGLTMLVATAAIAIALARGILGFIIGQLTRMRAAMPTASVRQAPTSEALPTPVQTTS